MVVVARSTSMTTTTPPASSSGVVKLRQQVHVQRSNHDSEKFRGDFRTTELASVDRMILHYTQHSKRQAFAPAELVSAERMMVGSTESWLPPRRARWGAKQFGCCRSSAKSLPHRDKLGGGFFTL